MVHHLLRHEFKSHQNILPEIRIDLICDVKDTHYDYEPIRIVFLNPLNQQEIIILASKEVKLETLLNEITPYKGHVMDY